MLGDNVIQSLVGFDEYDEIRKDLTEKQQAFNAVVEEEILVRKRLEELKVLHTQRVTEYLSALKSWIDLPIKVGQDYYI